MLRHAASPSLLRPNCLLMCDLWRLGVFVWYFLFSLRFFSVVTGYLYNTVWTGSYRLQEPPVKETYFSKGTRSTRGKYLLLYSVSRKCRCALWIYPLFSRYSLFSKRKLNEKGCFYEKRVKPLMALHITHQVCLRHWQHISTGFERVRVAVPLSV